MVENSKIKRRMLIFLDETIQHYNRDNRSFNNFLCSYIPDDPSTSEGCAIGRKLSKSYKKKMMASEKFSEINIRDVNRLFYELHTPRYFKGMPLSFLKQVQGLHDDDNFWCRNGLTDDGEEFCRKLKTTYGLYNI